MAKSLNLKTASETASVDSIPVKSSVQINFTDETSDKYIVEINSETEERALVNFDNLLTFNGLPVFTSNNAVLEG